MVDHASPSSPIGPARHAHPVRLGGEDRVPRQRGGRDRLRPQRAHVLGPHGQSAAHPRIQQIIAILHRDEIAASHEARAQAPKGRPRSVGPKAGVTHLAQAASARGVKDFQQGERASVAIEAIGQQHARVLALRAMDGPASTGIIPAPRRRNALASPRPVPSSGPVSGPVSGPWAGPPCWRICSRRSNWPDALVATSPGEHAPQGAATPRAPRAAARTGSHRRMTRPKRRAPKP